MNLKLKIAIGMQTLRYLPLALALLAWSRVDLIAASFPGNARLEVNDPNGALSWNNTNRAMLVQCWFKISVPSGTEIKEDMVIVANRKTGTLSDTHAYAIYFNARAGTIDFSAKGDKDSITRVLVERPYLDRWYHVAVFRQEETFYGFLDGRSAFDTTKTSVNIGNAATTNGMSIGGWNASGSQGLYFHGDIQEVSFYQGIPFQGADHRKFIVDQMFQVQPTNAPQLKGYFRLGASTIAEERLKNFGFSPVPAGTENAAPFPSEGKIIFEETDQAGEQSYFDSQKDGARDFIVPLSGAFSWSQIFLKRPTPGISFEMGFSYSSGDVRSEGALGRGGWRHIFETQLLPAEEFAPFSDIDIVGLRSWDGGIETWTNSTPSGTYRTRSAIYRGELVHTGTAFEWTTPERLIYTFQNPGSVPRIMQGKLLSIRDFNNNSVQIQYDTFGKITNVIDTAGGQYQFRHNESGWLTNVSFREWAINLDYLSNRLASISKTNSSGRYTNVNATWRFSYATNDLLERITDPRGNASVTLYYDKYGRKTNTVDAIGRANWTVYGGGTNQTITQIDAEGTRPGGDTNAHKWIEKFDRKHRLLSRKDPLGNETKFTYDDSGNATSITEPLGWKTLMAYDDRANLISLTSAKDEVSRRVIHTNSAPGRPHFNKGVQEIDPLGWTNFIVIDPETGNLLGNYDYIDGPTNAPRYLARYTYTKGLVETAMDGNGNITRMAYDTNGFLISVTDATGTNTAYYGYNELGWRTAETNAVGEVTRFGHDLNGNVVRTEDALGRVFLREFDGNGNLLSASDGKRGEKKRFTTYFYDAANQRTQTVDRASNKWTSTYTALGQIDKSIDPLGFVSTNFFDAATRLVAVSDALGNTVSNVYNANGKIIETIDQTGQKWTKRYDRLNRVTHEIDPQGDTRETTYNEAGRIVKIITPNGFPSMHEYDGRGRLRKWIDAEGFEWIYDYDGIQNVTNITDALGGHYVMEYGPRNERILEQNQDNFKWRYDYDPLGRLRKQTDPNGTTRTMEYDAGGRASSVTFNTGRVNFFQYDDNNNPELLTRTGSGPPTITTLRHDDLDRVVSSTDTFNRQVQFGYDPRGQRVTLSYPDGRVLTNRYDEIGRLTNQVDWAGRQMQYAWDKAGRLTRRVYPNGVVQENRFDQTGQMTNLTYSPTVIRPNSIQIALGYAYDRNGNKTGSTEKGTLDWQLPPSTDETANFSGSGRLTNRTVNPLLPSNPSLTVTTWTNLYDPSGNLTNSMSSAGISYALQYDEDNRTTLIEYRSSGGVTTNIANRYDALGRRVSRTMNGAETRYILDLGGGMERILCDMDRAGNITALYVHGLDLAYKVDTADTVTCYHADAMANVIALSDGNGDTVAQYAYTPYGRVLGSTNFNSQVPNPYLFVGNQGVMEELPGLYFMRARYYSADAGVFLSTDPVKKIGPGWKPEAYGYANSNPLSYIDPQGLEPSLDEKLAGGLFKAAEEYTDWLVGRSADPPDMSDNAFDAVTDVFFHKGQSKSVAPMVAKSTIRDNPLQYIAEQMLYDNPIAKKAKNLASMVRTSENIADALTMLILPDQGGRYVDGVFIPSLKQELLRKLGVPIDRGGISLRGDLTARGLSPAGAIRLRGDLVAGAERAARYGNIANAIQGTVSKFASGAISLAAPFIGSFAADAFGRVLPKSTPPVIKEAVKFGVSLAVTTVVKAAAPTLGAAVGTVVAGTVVAAAAAGKAAVIGIAIAIGVPKKVTFILLFSFAAAGLQYYCYRRRRPWRPARIEIPVE